MRYPELSRGSHLLVAVPGKAARSEPRWRVVHQLIHLPGLRDRVSVPIPVGVTSPPSSSETLSLDQRPRHTDYATLVLDYLESLSHSPPVYSRA
jgi:hypothetical protein